MSAPAVEEKGRRDQQEILARQGLRLPPVTLKQLHNAGIYCQPSISIEHQHLAKRYVLRGVESGGAVADLGAYSSFVDEHGNPLPWLQRVDSIGVNGVHAIVIAPVLVRLEMLRIGRTYDLLITRHCLRVSDNAQRPKLESSILFYGRRGSLEMDLWGTDAAFRGTVHPVFYTRSGEAITVPREFHSGAVRITTAASCIGCRHCHLLEPKATTTTTTTTNADVDTDLSSRAAEADDGAA
jgi:hypothetical protein